MTSQRSRLTRRSFVGMGAVLVLGLILGMGWVSWAQAADVAADVNVRARAQVVANFTFTLQPGELHGFVLGPVSMNRSYVVEVTPLDAADGGGHVVAFVQPESDGSNWNDVVRVQLLASSVAVNANIRVYALIPILGFFTQPLETVH